MRKLTMTSILVLTFICPAISEVNVDIATNANNPGCTNSVLQTYTGPAALEADYTANTINLNFYSDENTVYSTGTCTYDGGIELPSEDPTRTGYTFDGWKVRRAAANNNNQSGGNNQTTFDLSTIYEELDYSIYRSSLGDEGDTDDAEEILNNGEWAVIYDDGSMVKGVSTCSTEHPTTFWYDNNETFAPDHFSTTLTANQYSTDEESGMKYCWCKATSYTPVDENSGDLLSPLSVASARWVFLDDRGDADTCAYHCAFACADSVYGITVFRSAVFGVTE